MANKFYQLTAPGRLLFSELFDPKPYEENGVVKGKPRFEAHVVLDQRDVAPLRKLALAAAAEKELPGPIEFCAMPLKKEEVDNVAERAKNPGYQSPLHQGDRIILARQLKVYAKTLKTTQHGDEADKASEAVGTFLRPIIGGKTVLIARSGLEYPPKLGGLIEGVQLDFATKEMRAASKDYFYNGVHVIVKINLAAYTPFFGGVNAYLQSVFSLNTGDPIGGGGSASAIPTGMDFSQWTEKPAGNPWDN